MTNATSHEATLRSRRNFLSLSLAGILALSTRYALAAGGEDEVPHFESGNFQFTIIRPLQQAPDLKLFRLEGGTLDLTSLRGRPVLLNFWASWCEACRTELPILDRLHRSLGRDLHVIAISEDRAGRDTVVRFVRALGISALPIFLDPNGFVAHSDRDNSRNAPFSLYGMPITYAIASSGAVVGYMPGAADWSSRQAADLIAYLRDT